MKPRRIASIFVAASAVLSLAALLAAETSRVYLPLLRDPRPTPTSTATATATATATGTPTSTATATATGTATSMATATSTATPTTGPAAPELIGEVRLRPEYALIEELPGGGGTSCTPRSDALDGNPEWRSDIPPSHFVPVGGLVYPTVGEVLLQNVETGELVSTAPIVAGVDDRLSYRAAAIPPGVYELSAYLFYRHPLDPAGVGPRMYGTLLVADERLQSVTVNIPATPLPAQVRLDLRLVLSGDVCASR